MDCEIRPRLSGTDVSPGCGNPYKSCSGTRLLTLTVAFSTQANDWVGDSKLLAESNLIEMLWGSLAWGNSKAGSHVRTETTGC